MASILIHVDFSKPFFLKNDASNYILETILFQNGKDKRLHPVIFHSRKFIVAKINYEIHNKKLLAIIGSFQEWNFFIEIATNPITVYTNQKNLEYFMSTQVLN